MRCFKHRIPGKVKVPSHRARGSKFHRLARRWLISNPYCHRCGMPGEEVHHVVPVSVAPERMYDLDNLATVCRACHRAIHGKSE